MIIWHLKEWKLCTINHREICENKKLSIKGNIYELVGVQGQIHLTSKRSWLFFAHLYERLTLPTFPQ